MRQSLRYITQNNFRGGINQEPSGARADQVLDARNVYINERGDLVKRPGAAYREFNAGFLQFLGPDSVDFNAVLIFGTTVVSLASDSLVGNWGDPGDFVYLGFTQNYFSKPEFGIIIDCFSTTNVGLTSANLKFDYWDGSSWVPVETILHASNSAALGRSRGLFVASTSDQIITLAYVPPNWAQTTVQGQTKFFLRGTLVQDSLEISGGNLNWLSTMRVLGDEIPVAGIGTFEFAQRKRAVFYRFRDSQLFQANELLSDGSIEIADNLSSSREPMTFATIPEFSIAYAAYGNTVFQALAKGDPLVPAVTSPFIFSLAEVNDNPSIVGDEADVQEIDATYDRDTVAQLSEFPAANYIFYFKSFLFAAGIKDEPFTVRWSGSALDGAYNIWPTVSFAVLSEDDNSPITGLASLNEHPIVFKRDSIWMLVFAGTNNLGLVQFNVVKVASGIGAVSQASIKNVNGQLIFLAEDGFYSFDGTPNVRKLSDNIDEQVAKIVPGRKPFTAAVHWRTKNLYLCAAPIDGATTNNFVFVYDYVHNAWWFWDSIEVQSWLREEGTFDRETISFGDSVGRVFELTDRRRTDAGRAIETYVTPLRLGYGDGVTKSFRDLRLWGTNGTSEITLTRIRQDEETGSGPINMGDGTEAQWDTGEWGTASWVQDKRRTRKLRLRETGEWFQPKLTHDGTDRFELHGFSVGASQKGIR